MKVQSSKLCANLHKIIHNLKLCINLHIFVMIKVRKRE